MVPLTLPSPVPLMVAVMTLGLVTSLPSMMLTACRNCTYWLPVVLRATKYIVPLAVSITGVPTIPIFPLKFVYVPPHAPVISVFLGARQPERVKFFRQYSLPLSPSKA